jgi:hypothetical protein
VVRLLCGLLYLAGLLAARTLFDDVPRLADPQRGDEAAEFSVVVGSLIVAASITVGWLRSLWGRGRDDIPSGGWSATRAARRGGRRGQRLEFVPATSERVGMAVCYAGSLLLIGLLAVLSDDTVSDAWVAAPVAAAGALAVRCWRVALVCAQGTVTVRGLLGNRRIPVETIVRVTDEGGPRTCPAIWWQGRMTWPRCTHLFGFYGIDETQLSKLRGWINANRPPDAILAAPSPARTGDTG